MSNETDNAGAIIIIIDDITARLAIIRALDMDTMSKGLIAEIQAQLTDAQNCVKEAQDLAS